MNQASKWMWATLELHSIHSNFARWMPAGFGIRRALQQWSKSNGTVGRMKRMGRLGYRRCVVDAAGSCA